MMNKKKAKASLLNGIFSIADMSTGESCACLKNMLLTSLVIKLGVVCIVGLYFVCIL